MRLLFLSIGAANLFCVIFVESIPSKSHRSPHNKIAVILFSLVSSSCSHLTTLRAKRHLKNIIKCLEMIRVHGIKFCNNLLDFQLKMFTFLFLSEVHKSRWIKVLKNTVFSWIRYNSPSFPHGWLNGPLWKVTFIFVFHWFASNIIAHYYGMQLIAARVSEW